MKTLIIYFSLIFSFIAESKKIAIIGGGTAGTMAFNFLSVTDNEVHLFEARDELGGNARSVNVLNPKTNKRVSVDMGPLVFATGPWDLYLEVLDYFNVKGKDFYKFRGSIALWDMGNEQDPSFVTPKGNINYLKYLSRNDSIKNVVKVALALHKSYKDFKKGDLPPDTSIEQWLRRAKVNEKIARDILFPIFTSFHTARYDQRDEFAILPIMYTTTFRSPLTVKKLLASKPGIGSWIKMIGKEVNSNFKNGFIHLGKKVLSLSKLNNGKWVIYTNNNKQGEVFDSVIVSTHPHHAIEFLPKQELNNIMPLLSALHYHPTQGVLHNDHRYVLKNHKRFLNIIKRNDESLITTMNLGEIHRDMKGLFLTSGLNDDEIDAIEDRSTIFAKEKFYHPLYKTNFYHNTQKLREEASKIKGLSFAGGWTIVGEETQETATLSAYLAVRESISDTKKLDEFWLRKLTTLRKYLPQYE